MGEALTFVSSHFIALWTETLLYGSYTALYAICMHVLLDRRRHRFAENTPMITMASGLFLLGTAHVIVNFARGIQAFTVVENTPREVYSAFGTPISVAKQSIYTSTVILSDSLLIFRCYTVWGQNWKVILVPVVLLVLGGTTGFVTVYQFTVVEPGNEDGVYTGSLKSWATAAYGFSLAANVLVTSLIAWRIWRHTRRVRAIVEGVEKARYDRALAMVIESGAIYSLSLTIMLIMYTLNTHGQRIVYDALSQIAGIMPTLIIVRIGLGVNAHNTAEDTSHTLRFAHSTTTTTTLHSPAVQSARSGTTQTNDDATIAYDDPQASNISLYPPLKASHSTCRSLIKRSDAGSGSGDSSYA